VKLAGVLGLIGAFLTLAVGVYLVLISGVLSGVASGVNFAGSLWQLGNASVSHGEPYGGPSIVPGVTIVASAAAALPFASVLVLGRGARPGGIVLALAGVVACIAQAAFASGMSGSGMSGSAMGGSDRTLLMLIQPGVLVAASGLIACVKAFDRHVPLSA
jgi:hypothetical protein